MYHSVANIQRLPIQCVCVFVRDSHGATCLPIVAVFDVIELVNT